MNEARIATAPQTAADPKRARILESALKVVLAYGFSRTTMDDIAREAKISRPALYLLFRNKADIYRAVCTDVLNASLAEAHKALSIEEPISVRLEAAIDRGLLSLLDRITQSPHGAELLDMKSSLATDIVAEWHTQFAGLLSQAICEEAARIGTDLDARGLCAPAMADMLLDGLEGMKTRISDPEERRTATRGLIRVIVLALEAKRF